MSSLINDTDYQIIKEIRNIIFDQKKQKSKKAKKQKSKKAKKQKKYTKNLSQKELSDNT